MIKKIKHIFSNLSTYKKTTQQNLEKNGDSDKQDLVSFQLRIVKLRGELKYFRTPIV